ncbi:DsbA family protein [Nonomuraea thailandensis]
MKLDIYADVLCPWCYIGKRRLTAALARHPRRDGIEITWRAYELAPGENRTPARPPPRPWPAGGASRRNPASTGSGRWARPKAWS